MKKWKATILSLGAKADRLSLKIAKCSAKVVSIRKNIDKEITFSALNLKFILRVYADPETADRDLSRVLSPAEALPLAIALSLDSIAVGFGAALTDTDLVRTLFLALLFNALAVRLGCILGNKIAEKVSFNLSWLSGLLLIILAVMKLF